jgi:hypothetical protein
MIEEKNNCNIWTQVAGEGSCCRGDDGNVEEKGDKFRPELDNDMC